MDDLLIWDEKYSMGCPEIDRQHKKLFRLMNDLHKACATTETLKDSFRDAMHNAVDYVKTHFAYEEAFLQKAGYPDLAAHKEQHKIFVKKVLDSVNDYKQGKGSFVAFDFVRFLKDWILGHIMVTDKNYSLWLKANRPDLYVAPPQRPVNYILESADGKTQTAIKGEIM
jgi:hemerythrin